MKRMIVLAMLLCPSFCPAASRFLLQTELRTNYNGGGAVHFFSGHYYDASGNRISRRVFEGIDSSAALMSSQILSYDGNGMLTQELLLSATGDTLSIVRYTYGSHGLISAATLNKNGTIRFTDSMLYSGGSLIEQVRFNGAGIKTFFHRISYSGGLVSADSLFEPNGSGGFIPTAARIISRNTDSTVSQEMQWRKGGESWYPVGTTKMVYAQKLLMTAVTYETDGGSGRMVDSLRLVYDASGNRIKESAFNNERVPVYDIVFTWLDLQPPLVTLPEQNPMKKSPVCYREGTIIFGSKFTGSISIYRANGSKVKEVRIEKRDRASLGLKNPSGRYFAVINGTVIQSLAFTL